MSTNEFKARDQVVISLRRQLADVLRQRETLRHTLVGQNYVVCTSDGVYLDYRAGDEEARGIATGITRCSRFTEQDARTLAAATTNGNGDQACVVLLHDALDDEAASLLSLIATLEA